MWQLLRGPSLPPRTADRLKNNGRAMAERNAPCGPYVSSRFSLLIWPSTSGFGWFCLAMAEQTYIGTKWLPMEVNFSEHVLPETDLPHCWVCARQSMKVKWVADVIAQFLGVEEGWIKQSAAQLGSNVGRPSFRPGRGLFCARKKRIKR